MFGHPAGVVVAVVVQEQNVATAEVVVAVAWVSRQP